jgi:hypothetical protein
MKQASRYTQQVVFLPRTGWNALEVALVQQEQQKRTWRKTAVMAAVISSLTQ